MDATTIDAIETALVPFFPDLTGFSIAVIYDGEIAYAKGFGDAVIDDEPFTIYTKSLLASVSKTITSVIAMRMIQEETLDLNAEVNDFFPGYADFTDMTVRHLLAHQSGIAHYFSCPDGYDGPFDPDESFDVVVGCNTCMVPPGSGTMYTTFGTTLLGVIIDQVAQDAYNSSYIGRYHAWIGNPGGLTTLDPAFDNSDPELAMGHTSTGAPILVNWEDIGWRLPAGGFISNIVDLAKYGIGVLNNTFITQETLNLMIFPQDPGGSPEVLCGDLSGDDFALGWRYAGNFNNPNFRIWHNGLNEYGYTSYLALYPNREAGIAILTNQADEDITLANMRAAIEEIVICPAERIFDETVDWTVPNDFSAENVIEISAGISHSSPVSFGASRVEILPGTHYPIGRKVRVLSTGCTFD